MKSTHDTRRLAKRFFSLHFSVCVFFFLIGMGTACTVDLDSGDQSSASASISGGGASSGVSIHWPPVDEERLPYNTWGVFGVEDIPKWLYIEADTNGRHFVHIALPSSLNGLSVQVYDAKGKMVTNQSSFDCSLEFIDFEVTGIGNVAPPPASDGDTSEDVSGGAQSSQTAQSAKIAKYYIWVGGTSAARGSFQISYSRNIIPRNTTPTPLKRAEWANGIIAARAVQWFKFETMDTINYFQFKAGSLKNLKVQVYDENGNPKGDLEQFFGNDTFFTRSLMDEDAQETETFYLRAWGLDTSSFGEYRLTFSDYIVPYDLYDGDPDLIKLGDGGDWRTAALKADKPVAWFWFTAGEMNFIHVKPDPPVDSIVSKIELQVYAEDGQKRGSRSTFPNGYALDGLRDGERYFIRVLLPDTTTDVEFGINVGESIVPPGQSATPLEKDWPDDAFEFTSPGDAVHWYAFTATADTHFIHYSAGDLAGGRIYAQVYTAGGIPVGGASTFFPGYMSRSLEADTYYVRVWPYESGATGTYCLSVNTKIASPDEVFVDLDLNEDDNPVPDTGVKKHTVDEPAAYEFFSFTAAADKQFIHFEYVDDPDVTTKSDNIFVQLYDSFGAPIGGEFSLDRINAPFMDFDLSKGNVYYLRARAGTENGSYGIAVSISPSLEGWPPDTEPDGLKAILGWGQWADAEFLAPDEETEIHWFLFRARESRQSIDIELLTLADGLNIRVYDAGSYLKGRFTLYDSGSFVCGDLTANKEYYIQVWPYTLGSKGTYKIRFAPP